MATKARRNHAPAAADPSAELRTLFGANLRRARNKAKLPQGDVAGRARISQHDVSTSQHYVSEVEGGVHNITLRTMASLADAVGVEVTHLFRPQRRRARRDARKQQGAARNDRLGA
jgi:transcriptional regulator with XRE-family HTH domain